MEKIYFLSGLGSKIETTIEFNLELNKYGYEIKYIDIPGQYSNIDVNIKNEKEFLDWIKSVIPKNSLVMGYSLGADLLLKFSRFLYAKKKIILDGGIFEDDYMKTTFEEEKEYSRNYILENSLNMDINIISSLFDIRYDDYKDIFSLGLKDEILLLLSDLPKDAYEYKNKKVEKYKKTGSKNIKVYFIENTTHNFYTEKPKEIATKISEFLKWN